MSLLKPSRIKPLATAQKVQALLDFFKKPRKSPPFFEKIPFKLLFELLKFVIGVGLLISATSNVDWGTLIQSLSSFNGGWFLLAFLSVLVGLLLKILRFRFLLRSYNVDCSVGILTQSFFIGQAANILLPFRGGEMLRFGILAAGRSSLAVEITAAIVMEKFLDLIALALIVLQVLYDLPVNNIAWVHNRLFPLVILGSLAVVIFIAFGPAIWRWLKIPVSKLRMGWIQKIIPQVEKLLTISMWLRKPDKLGISVGATGLIWLSALATNICLFRSLKLDLGFEAGGLVLVLVYIGLLPAMMPGNMGPFYFFAQLALMPFAVSRPIALLFSVVLHLIVSVPPLVFGGFVLIADKLIANPNLHRLFSRGNKP